MRWLPALILVGSVTLAAVADETIYRYEGDVHPLDPSAGWVTGNPCDPPCSEFIEDGHFVRFWSVTGDLANYDRRIAVPPTPPHTRCGSNGASVPTSRWDRS